MRFVLVAAPVAACSEYRLGGKDSGEPEHTATPDTEENLDTSDTASESGIETAACADLTGAPAGAAPHERTCSALPAVDWTPTVEIELDLVSAGLRYVGMPTVSAAGSGGNPAIYLPVGDERAVAVDGTTGTITTTVDGIGSELRGIAVTGSKRREGLWLAALTIWSSSGESQSAMDVVARGFPGGEGAGPMGDFLVPGVADLDHDGEPEFLADGAVVSLDGIVSRTLATERWGFSTLASDLDLDGAPELLNSYGIYSPAADAQTPWTGLVVDQVWYRHWLAAPVQTAEGLRVFGVDGAGVFLADEAGTVQWYTGNIDEPELVVSDIPAIGDVTGDGYPELCAKYEHTRFVMDTEGTTLWTRLHPYLDEGGCSLADLDADGRYEVIEWGRTGLYIYRGRDAALLASMTDIGTLLIWNPPVVADVDDDGSMEIVVTGAPVGADAFQSHLYVIGAAHGRWARGRPVWNQTTYDITSVRDDGSIVSFPFPAWQTYNAFRAQPAHDGDHADLVVDATDACATSCESGGTVRVAAQVSNLGSHDAPAGATVRLLTWTPDLGLREVASTTLPDPVPAGAAAQGVVLDVPWEDWGDIRVLQIDGDLADECDRVNDRIEADAIPDPCAG